MVLFVPAERWHINTIANRMRAWDRTETEAMGFTPKKALRYALAGSTHAWTCMVEDRPEGMFGCAPVSIMSGEGSPWMLATDRAFDHARDFLTLGPVMIDEMLRTYSHLSNRVAIGNTKAIAMLRRWGFTIGRDVSMVGTVAFVSFSRGV